MSDEIDLEDIECRLYSQVFHSTVQHEEIASDYYVTSCGNNKLHNNRYFAKNQISSIPTFIPLQEEETTNSTQFCPVQNNISVNSNSTDIIISDGNLNNQFQNNITVNQYTVPLIIDSGVNEVLERNPENRAYFVPWCVENKTLLDKKNSKRLKWLERKKQKNREKRNRKRLRKVLNEVDVDKRVQARIDDIICISDESDNDCEIVTNTFKTDLKNRDQNPLSSNMLAAHTLPACNDFDDDDDIIYIPPPPIDIVNVDIDSEEEKSTENVCETLKEGVSVVNQVSCSPNTSSNKTNQQLNNNSVSNSPGSPGSNDFLENTTTEVEVSSNNFNFSLHGSDFNNTGDFVRPANPVEYCETESSCSTNDFNKESSGVKTIVFKEVDFPKEDMFSDKNLEGFGTYITPRRNSNNCNKIQTDDTSSSSEKDYEPPDIPNSGNKISELEFNKKLPILSPMQCVKASNSKNEATLKSCNSNLQTPISSKKLLSKRKSITKDDSESSSSENDDESKTRKRKTIRKKKVANKGKRSIENVNETVEFNNQVVESIVTDSLSKKKVKHCSVDEKEVEIGTQDVLVESNKDGINNDNPLKVSLKKKRKNLSTKAQIINSTSDEISTKRLKRKKRKNGSEKHAINKSVDELNNSHVDINDIYERQLLPSNDNNCKRNDKDSANDCSNQKELIPSNDTENECDSNNTTSNFKLQNTEQKHTENSKESVTIPNLGTPQNAEESSIDDEFIVIDETFCDKSNLAEESHIEVLSSDSECDFRQLEDVGHDLKLVNCSNSNIVINNEIPSVSQNRNIQEQSLEDYRNFDLDEIQKNQSDDPDDWKILATDRLLFLNFDRNKGPRCNRCRQFGHIAMRCTEKPFPPNCSLCGACGHQEPRCPNKRCTQCGNEGDYSTTYCWKCFKFRNSICRICNMKGHIAKTCPDLWRRYHLTTREGPLIIPQAPLLKPRNQLWCSGCAGQGHLEHECNYYNREYPPTNPSIVSYKDVLQGENRCTFPEETATESPPPPVWTMPEEALLPVPLINLPSSSQSIPYDSAQYNPSLVSLISNLKSLLPNGTMIDESQTVPSNIINCHPPTRVLNPFSVIAQREKTAADHRALNQLMLDYVNNDTNFNYVGHTNQRGEVLIRPQMVHQGARELLRKDQRKVKQIIMAMPCHEVKEFLGTQLAELENIISQTDPKFLRKKLFKFDRIYNCRKTMNCEIVKEKCFWDRVLNMFIFGVHQLRDGKIHFDFLKKCLSDWKENKLDTQKRKAIFNAYKYIFDGTRHGNINYYKVMQQLIQKD